MTNYCSLDWYLHGKVQILGVFLKDGILHVAVIIFYKFTIYFIFQYSHGIDFWVTIQYLESWN